MQMLSSQQRYPYTVRLFAGLLVSVAIMLGLATEAQIARATDPLSAPVSFGPSRGLSSPGRDAAQPPGSVLGPQIRVGPSTWAPAQLNPILSPDGQAAVVEVSPPQSAGYARSAVPLYVWLANDRQVRATGVRGDPVAVSNDGRSIAYQCDPGPPAHGSSVHVQLCFWRGNAKHVQRISLQPYCPDRNDEVAGAIDLLLSADWHTLMMWCIHGSHTAASSVVLLHLGRGAPKMIAVLHGMATEEAALSADGSTATMNRYGGTTLRSTFIYHSGQLHRVVRHGVGPISQNGQFAAYESVTAPTIYGSDLLIENLASHTVADIPARTIPLHCGGCLEITRGLSDDGQRLFFDISGEESAGSYMVDQPTGTVIKLDHQACQGGPGGCVGITSRIVSVSADGHRVLYKIEGPATDPEVGLFARAVR